MKKTFIFMLFSALTLAMTGCGDEIQIPQSNGETSENSTEQMYQTVFSTGNDATRTSMDANRKFYWTTDDQIWVETSSRSWVKTFDSKLSDDRKTADFYLTEALKDKYYNLVYTGNGSTSATRVTIKDTQAQSAPNNADHIGTSGDCGVAEAERQSDGKYKFSLKHKAAYLVICPYLEANMPTGSKLVKVAVEAYDESWVQQVTSGTYNFDKNGLLTVSSGINSLTLTCNGTTGFEIGKDPDAALATSGCYIVMRPTQETQKIILVITYHLQYDGGWIQQLSKIVPARTYAANSVTQIKHKLNSIRYKWGAEVLYVRDAANHNTTGPTELPNWFDGTVPNRTEMLWYISAGVYWDANQEWPSSYNTYIDRPTSTLHNTKSGLWLKKRKNIPGFNRTTAPSGVSNVIYENSSLYHTGTPPNQDDYFFLPAFGYYDSAGFGRVEFGSQGFYWLSGSILSGGSVYGETFIFRENYVNAGANLRQLDQGMVAGYRPDGTPWFQ